MAIEVEVPVEIEDYKEKIIFGLSLRQLACLSAAVALSIGSYYFCTHALGWTMDEASYVIIIESMPLMALGFVRKDGQPFEKFIKLMIRHRLGIHKLPISVQIEELKEERKNHVRKENSHFREAIVFIPTQKSCKRKRKATRQKIKAAAKEYRAAKRDAKKICQAKSRAKKRCRLH